MFFKKKTAINNVLHFFFLFLGKFSQLNFQYFEIEVIEFCKNLQNWSERIGKLWNLKENVGKIFEYWKKKFLIDVEKKKLALNL